MSFGSHKILVGNAQHVGRLIATLVTLPAIVLSPLAAQAILIHDHHGHDTHTHTLSVHDLDELQINPEHQHEEHEHDGPAADLAECENSSLVILLDLPESLTRGRLLSNRGTTLAGSPSSPSARLVATLTQAPDPSYVAHPSSTGVPMRAHDLLERILLSNRALLL